MEPRARLRSSPAFCLALAPDGRPFVAQQTEPYLQYWLSERERRLWSAFAARRGALPSQVMDEMAGDAVTPAAERRRCRRDIAGMLQAGVLAPLGADSSRYDRAMVRPYLEHRPFPPEITAQIVRRGGIDASSRVLDLAGGPGDLALQLARQGAQVSLMDWSAAFLASARRRARAAGLPLRTLHESCNALVHAGGVYDAVTVSQALHWLDDVAVCRGVLRVLGEGGSFFVVHSAFDVPDGHPLAHVLGHDSVLGAKARRPFADEVQALHDRVALLLRALDTGGVERYDPTQRSHPLPGLLPAGLALFRQRRPLGLGFLRGLLTTRHLEAAGLEPGAFWRDARARCAGASASALSGTHDWALLHFRRRAGSAGEVQAARCRLHRLPFAPVGLKPT